MKLTTANIRRMIYETGFYKDPCSGQGVKLREIEMQIGPGSYVEAKTVFGAEKIKAHLFFRLAENWRAHRPQRHGQRLGVPGRPPDQRQAETPPDLPLLPRMAGPESVGVLV